MSGVTFGPFWHASTESRLRALNLFQVLRGRLLCVPKIALGQDQSTAVERVSRYWIEWTWVKLSKFMFKAFASWTSQWCTKLSPNKNFHVEIDEKKQQWNHLKGQGYVLCMTHVDFVVCMSNVDRAIRFYSMFFPTPQILGGKVS